LVVGFVNDKVSPYWIVKNSVGVTWGNKGFGKIQKGVNMCKIADEAAHPNLN
jgi:C1A family cysteine protease